MKRGIDEAVKHVLGEIRDASAPEGLEQRVLAAVREREDAAPERRWGWVWAAAGAAVMGVVVYLTLPVRTHREVVMERPAIAPKPYQVVVEAPRAAVGDRRTRPVNSAVSEESTVNPPEEMNEIDRLAFEEMHAASMPAPEMPLTEQERLLLRMARQRTPEEFSELNPVERDVLYAAAKAEVHDFFEPVTMIEPE